MKTKFRLLVKGFARVKVGESYKLAIESEEICVQNATMSFEDYLKCRVVDLLIHIFYNNLFSNHTFEFFETNGLSVFKYLNAIFEMRKPKRLDEIINIYLQYIQNELFDSMEDINSFLEKEDTYQRLMKGEIDINPTYYYTTMAKNCVEALISVVRKAANITAGRGAADCIERDILQNDNWGLGLQRSSFSP